MRRSKGLGERPRDSLAVVDEKPFEDRLIHQSSRAKRGLEVRTVQIGDEVKRSLEIGLDCVELQLCC